jgi:hypothetical protein
MFLPKNYEKALEPHCEVVGLEIGENAEADLYFPLLKADINAPCPPILNPVIDLLFALTWK